MLEFNTDSSCPQFNENPKPIDYSGFPPQPDIEGYRKGGLGRLTLSSVTPDHLLQLYTRLELSDDRINNLQDSYVTFDFVTGVEPPMISSAGIILEGRGRIKAAIKQQETFIPIFIYDPTDASEGRVMKTSLGQNDPKAEENKEPNTMQDWALTARGLVKLGTEKGGIDDNPTAVTSLLDELNWTKRWPRDGTRTTLRKMIDKELEALRNGDTMVHRKIDTEVKLWVKENYSGSKNYVLVCVDNLRYARTIILENVFKSVKKGSDPVHIILYTKRHTSSDAIKNVQKFVKYLDELYENIFEHVGTMQLRDSEISSFLRETLHPDKLNLITSYNLETRPYIVAGCVPQVEGYHDIDGDNFVKVKDYGKKKRTFVKEKKPTVTDFMTIDESLGVAA